MIFVLDSSAMIAYLRGEKGTEIVQTTLFDSDNTCLANVVNLCEVFYDCHRRAGLELAQASVADLETAGVMQSVDLTDDVWQRAAVLKAVHRRVSLADCFMVALAVKVGGTILTADHHELDILAELGLCSVKFIR